MAFRGEWRVRLQQHQGQEALLKQACRYFSTEQIAGVIPQAPIVVERERKPPLEKLRKYGAKEFNASKDDSPEIAEYWLDGTSRVLEQLQCTPEDKLICATSLLIDEAYTWWTIVQQRVSTEQRTWQFFLDEFKKKFITEAYLDARRKDFLYLRQNRLSVSEYEREFTRLSRYGKGIVATEAERCKKFQEGER
ncbi:uncharacterized protein LOC119371380 [Jatropha curcas]|uniref:uncharacterized protein LOC119371380 n=1 Tax=Jatropha curcas TaxID=180498 RepID=UPI0018935467|nr:uncharacterized protein LOC119371380 [Jatropha curcas]